jgi:uncharacterized protein YdiU (UPF0061 family)
MKKYIHKLEGFNEIYKDPIKIKLLNYLNEIEKKIEKIFYNKDLTIDLCAQSIHKLIYVIEKKNISKEELEKMIYSLTYYFLKEYLNIKELIKISNMSKVELIQESEKTIELLKKYYKLIKNREIDIKEIFIIMKKFVDRKQNNIV